MKRLLPLLLAVALAACAPDSPDTAAPAADAPAATPAPAETPAPATDEVVDEAPADETAPAEEAAPVEEAPAEETAAAPAPAAPAAEPTPPAPPVMDPARAPRPGIDYVVLPTPQPTFGSGGIEVAEVFAYTCIHCANLQPHVSSWKPTLASDVRFEYVPGVFGGPSDNLARMFFAAQSLGLLDKMHEATFNAFFIDRRFTTGSLEELAGFLATFGSDEATITATMNSFAVNAKLDRARQFALRTGVSSTPTFIINGKYSAHVNDRGPQGLFDTVEFLVAHERAGTTP
ncbi:thiol:disulfide interchange protein DsbA/DsbL [Arenimonas composti]|uniref:Thiol:disulfide interchange protein DsbA n=1 Tax=Arenimonas composti TR7-09 = DSM 18010 TaxID=1121013 RepID=A0A091BBG7_9GAMM|nr:thiol:disulfide interchange protein DsbA/DsbL [Arenimonas composti]KFN49081.1 hypothetical protein P873_12370 [Arenimonas composti TR7-09 = DSM 18010]